MSEAEFSADAAAWARAHSETHLPHVAVADDTGGAEIVGMAWLALTPRVATTNSLDRWSGDLQSCYVLPEHRGNGVGGALVQAVLATARERGAEHVTVHASPRSVELYVRHGFRSSGRLLWADVAVTER
ncbi:GNAT family N-acetyltransferase [Gryllotalpicola protaetiae]|uniref:GNAT family N-acetyltransferase n=2 Tax=Gryllotalpicola protaetiae TaxID=2419771 RepID=A0A387C3V0_9MICO|nr:GNAT family N-acetyltransferase [Gryllotalpicola protaetiae]